MPQFVVVVLCAFLSLLKDPTKAVSTAQSHQKNSKCYLGVSLYNENGLTKKLDKSINEAVCCAAINLGANTISYYYLKSDDSYGDTAVSNGSRNMCFFQKKTGDTGDKFQCCCFGDRCNTNSFVKFYFYKYMAERSPFYGGSVLEYTGPITFVGLVIIFGFIVYMILDCCVIQPYKSKYHVEMSPEFYVNLRGTKVLPYLTKGEAKLVIQQIKTARTTDPPEMKSIKKKSTVIGVYTYSTTATVTNRELGSVWLSQPKVDPFLSTLVRMIEIGPREVRFDADHLLEIIEKAESIFTGESTLLEVPVPCQIYGDIHGQYSDLLRWLHVNDRGRHSIEVIVMLFLLKIVMPHDVFLCRGNHEDFGINKVYSFYAELEARLEHKNNLHDRVFERFMQCFTHMPLAARIGTKILALHGGISPKIQSWEDIINIKRPTNFVPGSLACDLTWSDPNRGSTEFEVNYKRDRKNGIGYLFGLKQVDDVCKILDIDLILRGHQAPMGGYELFGDKLITIFSAPGYRTSSDLETNYGASINVDENGSLIITRIGVDNHVRLLRDLQKLDKGEPYTDMNKLMLKPKHEDDEFD